jgi:hypothetical protein
MEFENGLSKGGIWLQEGVVERKYMRAKTERTK